MQKGFPTITDWNKHIHAPPLRAHGIWDRIKDYVPGWGYSKAEIDDFFEGEDSGKKKVDWARITSKPGTFTPAAHILVGAKHTAGGLTIGHVLRASGDSAFAWAQLQHGDLGGVTSDLHHAQLHAAEHEVGGGDLLAFVDITGFGTYLDTDNPLKKTSSPEFVKLTLTQTTGIPPLAITSPTLVNNLNVDLWDDKHLPALESDKVLSNAGGILKWVDMGAGEHHNLLSVAHPDTVTGSVAQGDIITGQSAGISTNSIKNAGLGANVAGAGADWQNPTSIYGSDNNHAIVALSADETSDYLRATTFGFSIPSNATIVGIKVEIELAKSGGVPIGTIVDSSVKIVKTGSEQGDENASMTSWPTGDTYFVYGGETDLWGLTWTYSEINASNFGVSIKALEYSGEYPATARVDHVRITVYYTIPGFAWKKLVKGTDGKVLQLVSGYPAWVTPEGDGASTFLELTDTPANYNGSAGKFAKVNATPDALVFADIAWADVSKTGSNLTDLATRQHAGLTDVTHSQHHNKTHALTGVTHTAAGLTIGHVIRATGADTFAWGFLTKLGTISAGVWQGTAIANAYIAGLDQNLWQTSSPTFDDLHSIGQMDFDAVLEDKISLYENRLGGANMYGFGVEAGFLYFKSNPSYRWYCGVNADEGASDTMELSAAGLTINGIISGTSISLTTYPKLDDMATPDDNEDLNASISRHGLLRKLPDKYYQCLNGIGQWMTLYDSTSVVICILSKISTNLRNSNNEERYNDMFEWVKVKEVKMGEPTGLMSISFEMKSEDGPMWSLVIMRVDSILRMRFRFMRREEMKDKGFLSRTCASSTTGQ